MTNVWGEPMRASFSTIIVAAAAAFSLIAAPAAAQHGGGGHTSGGHNRGNHASGGGTHRGSHANGGGSHQTTRRAVAHVNALAPRVDHRPTLVVPTHGAHFGSLGAFGLGLGLGAYRHPLGFSRYNYGYPGYYGSSRGYYGGYARSGHARLRILDAPGDAQVIDDGAYVGIVDDFDGRLQHLELAPGVHQIEIRARGFAPIVFDINAIDGRTITYRAQLVPNRP